MINIINENVAKEIIDSAFTVHKYLGFGFLEKVYENALVHELEIRGIGVKQQVHITIYYKDVEAGNYIADLVVEENILLELKCCKEISSVHKAQTLNYLKATRKKLGFIINFANPRIEIKRLVK